MFASRMIARGVSNHVGLMVILAMVTTVVATAAQADPHVVIHRHKPCNLFDARSPVTFEVVVVGVEAGAGEATAVVTDYAGESKTHTLPVKSAGGDRPRLTLDLGIMETGYYELKVDVVFEEISGKRVKADSTVSVPHIRGDSDKFQGTEPFSFGVVHFVDRTAEKAREQKSRFGLKLFQIGTPGVWWRREIVYDVSEFVEASAKLGLQWNRHSLDQGPSEEPGIISTHDLIKKYPMNVVLKVEGFPRECYNAQRYGPLDQWKAKHKGKNWRRCTVPRKEPYQKWLQETIAEIPADQNVYEIGNEVWNYLSAEEFVEWAQMAREAIQQVRPDAIIGVDPGMRPGYTDVFLALGGMDGMTAVFIHPYSFTPLPEHRTRAQMRNLQDRLREATGKTFDIYVTEYGWPTAPEDSRGHSVSEAVQAQRTARQSLMLYAEGAKVLIPHWLADREYDITDREHFFGFFRLSGQPKPVVIAHATCARMIDSSRFVGDLWYGPGVGAMLFERRGQHTLALWTAEQDKQVEVNVDVPQVTVVDIVGRETTRQTIDGKLSLHLDGNVTYLVGVSPTLVDQATPPDQPLNPDRWSTREGAFTMARAGGDVQIDGKLNEWPDEGAVDLTGKHDAGSVRATLRWDEKFVYVAMRANDVKDGNADLFQLFLSTKPSRSQGSFRMYEYTFSLKGGPDANESWLKVARGRADAAIFKPDDPSGVKWAVQTEGNDWTGELAIPIEFLKGFPQPEAEARIGCRLTFRSGDKRLSYGNEKPRLWPYLTLED